MPVLLIRYGDLVLHDGDVDELTFNDAPGEVSVTGRLATPKPAGGGGLLDLLAGARKAQTQRMVEEKRQENLEEDSAAADPEAENA